MKIEDYQTLAMRTSTDGHDRILNGCMGLIGESGEIVDIVKKWKFQSGDHAELPKDKLIDECGDVLWYCAELASGLNENLAWLYRKISFRFDEMYEINKETPLEITVMRLSAIAIRPAIHLFDTPRLSATGKDGIEFIKAQSKSDVVGIMTTIRDILHYACGVTLEDAMEHNIEKLRRRYPDGFDPERSLHRSE